jgi:heat shock protein HtpX
MRAMFLEEDDDGIFGLFATHPPVAKRIAALQRYAGGRIADHAETAAPITRDEPAPIAPADPSTPDTGEHGPWG